MANQRVSSFVRKLSIMLPGIKFSPSDQQLISHYLKHKLRGLDNNDVAVAIISEVRISKFEPWDLPAKSVIQSDEEWIFFSPTERKYPNGPQTKRATQAGYWKATGKEHYVKLGKTVIGTKRTLVSHIGRSPRGSRTQWIMDEYCFNKNVDDRYEESYLVCRLRKNQAFSRKDRDHNRESTSLTLSSPSSSGPSSFSTSVFDDLQHLQQPEEAQVLRESTVADMELGKDDCFVDILNDDIIQLDESPLRGSWQLQNVTENPCERLVSPEVAENEAAGESTQLACAAIPTEDHFQGTANRRIRLGRVRYKKNHVELPGLSVEDVAKKVEEKVTDGDGAAKTSSVILISCQLLCVIFVAVVLFLQVS